MENICAIVASGLNRIRKMYFFMDTLSKMSMDYVRFFRKKKEHVHMKIVENRVNF